MAGLGRLSRPLNEMHDDYRVVVIGSGYGASIAASRFARAGQSVCLLERGRELHPGEYPSTTIDAARHVQMQTVDGQEGDLRNLYAVQVGEEMSVFHGCGLGGTSLVNANVALRAEPWVLDDPRWPEALRKDRKGLEEGYRRAEEILQPATYPESYPPLAKIAALERSAAGSLCYRTPINVTFQTGPNHVGVDQQACTGCGDCVTGCNYGAKNTLLMNYLPDAVAHGAHIFTEVDVRWVERAGDRWAVRYQPLGVGRGRFDAPPLTVIGDVVMVGGGTVGSNEVMLRSRAHGLAVSYQLGTRFTGNGDVLGFGYATGEPVHGVGAGPNAPEPDRLPGPCITAVIDDRPDPAGEQGFVIEDAVIPGAIGEIVPAQLASQALPDWLKARLHHGGGPLGLLRSVLTRGRRGVLDQTQTFLVMGHDNGDGRLVLNEDDRIRIDWPRVGTSSYYERVNARLVDAAKASGGRYVHSPIWTKWMRHSLVTVHPLGGCPMADRAEDGVVDERGRVFAGTNGTGVHEGLYVCDAAIVPRPLGVNPLLTISALAERIAALAAKDRGWKIDYRLPAAAPPQPEAPPPPARPGLRFTEEMKGWFAPGEQGVVDAGTTDLDAFEQAAAAGETAASPMSFILTISSDDARALTADLASPMHAVGTVSAPSLDSEPLTVEGGAFQLFAPDDPDPEIRHMWYRLPLLARDERRLFFEGFKVVKPGTMARAWPATTTLYVTVRADAPDGAVLGRGILRIAPLDFAKQMRSMTVTGGVGAVERLRLLGRFQEAFAGLLLHEYGTVIQRQSRMNVHAPPRPHRPLRVPPPEVVPYRSADGVDLRLTRYEGGKRGPVVISHGFGANPLTFSTDTIETNALEYLVEHGFDVWVQEWRGSTLLPSCYGTFDADDVARLDHAAAEAAIIDATGRRDLHWVTHCVGSVTVMMSALAGTTKPASILCSQVGMQPVGPTLTKLKTRFGAAKLLRAAQIKRMTTDSYTHESLGQRFFDLVLHFYPIPKVERCDQEVCRRLAFIYGNAVHHAAVDELTHYNLHELFGTANMQMLQHLSNMAKAERLLDADGGDTYLPHLERLRDVPITFLHGAHNLVWVPESTRRDYDLLVGEFGSTRYRRLVFDRHGHQDTIMGNHA
ncbi:MAG TPA: GMC oxidoreductase, partial [Acidimicrobiia bacterium]|nr:GMC oxidoreductase [Acidimicrobiia bacterium]